MEMPDSRRHEEAGRKRRRMVTLPALAGLEISAEEETFFPQRRCQSDDVPNCFRWSRETTPETVASEGDFSAFSDFELDEGCLPGLSAVQDVVADPSGALELLSVDGAPDRQSVRDLRPDDLVTIRVFRFLDEPEDADRPWEKELRNVNSGSLLWLPVHLEPQMHSVRGAKYGKWFTVHHIRVHAQHFGSQYHMCEEGFCPAKTFGTSPSTSALVTMKHLERGYMWFASPDGEGCKVSDEESLASLGWQHVGRAGPFSGDAFLSEWHKRGRPMDEVCLQNILRQLEVEVQ